MHQPSRTTNPRLTTPISLPACASSAPSLHCVAMLARSLLRTHLPLLFLMNLSRGQALQGSSPFLLPRRVPPLQALVSASAPQMSPGQTQTLRLRHQSTPPHPWPRRRCGNRHLPTLIPTRTRTRTPPLTPRRPQAPRILHLTICPGISANRPPLHFQRSVLNLSSDLSRLPVPQANRPHRIARR